MEALEFGTAYSAVTGKMLADIYVPNAENDNGIDSDNFDILIDGLPNNLADWDQVTGKTGQHGYRGAVMHASENASDELVMEWVRDAGGDVFAIVVVEAPCNDAEPCFPEEPDYCSEYGCDAEPAGWAVIYKESN